MQRMWLKGIKLYLLQVQQLGLQRLQAEIDRFWTDELDVLVDELALHELQLRMIDDEQSTLQRSRAAARIAESTEPIASAIEATGGALDHARTARLVQSAIEERLRPLSHQFWFEREPLIETPSSGLGLVRRVVGPDCHAHPLDLPGKLRAV